MESSAILTAMEPVFLISRVSGVFPLNDNFNISPFWALLPPSLLCVVTANAFFFYEYIQAFSGFAGTIYVLLCWTLTLATVLLVLTSFSMGNLYKKLMIGIAEVENFFLQLGIQFNYKNGLIVADIALRFLSIFLVSVFNFRAYVNDVLQLYLRAIGFYLNQWSINCVEIHIVALSTHLSTLFKALTSALPSSSNLENLLEVSTSLFEVSDDFHELLAKQALIASAALFFSATLDMYFIIIVFQEESVNSPTPVFTLMRTVIRSYQLWRLVASVGLLMDEAKKLDAMIYEKVLEDPTNELARKEKIFLYFAMKQKVTFSAYGFFPIDFTLVHSIVAATTSYLVILVQFGESSDPNIESENTSIPIETTTISFN